MKRSRTIVLVLAVTVAAACTSSATSVSTSPAGDGVPSVSSPAVGTASPTRSGPPVIVEGEPWIAYQDRATGGGYGVHLVRPDGTGIHWAMAGVPGKFQEHPDWSPDGRRLAFSVTDTDDTEDIWVADVDGSNAERIVDCEMPCVWADEPAWSPDGTAIVFQRTILKDARRTSTIERWDVSAKVARVLMTASEGMTFYAPRWAPDGRSLVVEHATNGKTMDDPPVANAIAIIDLAGSVPTLRELTKQTRLANNPDWSPRGDLIVFSLPAPNTGFDVPADLYALSPAGGPMRRLTSLAEASGRAIQPTFTPDGLWVIFALDGPSGTDRGLALVPVAGGDPRSATSSGSSPACILDFDPADPRPRRNESR